MGIAINGGKVVIKDGKVACTCCCCGDTEGPKAELHPVRSLFGQPRPYCGFVGCVADSDGCPTFYWTKRTTDTITGSSSQDCDDGEGGTGTCTASANWTIISDQSMRGCSLSCVFSGEGGSSENRPDYERPDTFEATISTVPGDCHWCSSGTRTYPFSEFPSISWTCIPGYYAYDGAPVSECEGLESSPLTSFSEASGSNSSSGSNPGGGCSASYTIELSEEETLDDLLTPCPTLPCDPETHSSLCSAPCYDCGSACDEPSQTCACPGEESNCSCEGRELEAWTQPRTCSGYNQQDCGASSGSTGRSYEAGNAQSSLFQIVARCLKPSTIYRVTVDFYARNWDDEYPEEPTYQDIISFTTGATDVAAIITKNANHCAVKKQICRLETEIERCDSEKTLRIVTWAGTEINPGDEGNGPTKVSGVHIEENE